MLNYRTNLGQPSEKTPLVLKLNPGMTSNQKKPPYISVVIPAFNEAKSIVKTLESLKNQDYQGNFEIIVVDNNSTDNTSQIAKKYGAKVIFEANKGAAFARQAGFSASKGQIIASTDSDTIVPVNWLSWINNQFQSHPNAVLVSGMWDFYDGHFLPNFFIWALNYPLFVIFSWYSGANMAVKKDAFIKVGGFNTSLPLSEDSDLGVRLRKLGPVLRTNSFKVLVSARRYNQLGFWGGLWDYSYNYFKFKLNTKSHKVSFRSGSEIPQLGFLPKLAIQAAVIAIVLSAFLGGAFEIKPVKAQMIKSSHHFRFHIPHMNVPDVDMPNFSHISSLHYLPK